MTFTWINGAVLAAWFVCPLAAIVIVKETNLWLRRRALRHERQIADRRRIMRMRGAR